jgi:photosystem II stability/assembly factor-like uncharacterized protein
MIIAAILLAVLAFAGTQQAQDYNPNLYSGMKWRLIGPFRGGRVTAVAGVPGQPAVYYMGTPGGGVWKTTDGGLIWKPIFDDMRVASIGALAVAPSNPNVIYVATGEQMPGEGIFKSTDAGATWANVGLRRAHYLTSVIVDPRNPDIALVGSMGDFAPGPWRGVFRTANGGKTWDKVLFKDDQAGIADMCMDPGDPRVLYATFWRPDFGPFGPVSSTHENHSGAIYKTTDGGLTWQPLPGTGLPEGDLGRVGISVAPGNHGQRIFAIVNQGVFRSDDAGANWHPASADPRVVGNGYFSRIFSDPRNADVVYVMQTAVYRSTDGGRNFQAFTGAPSGDDFHVLWIDPTDSQRMILGVDQGATISVDGGATWSNWLNQPTGQFYHVSTDDSFPYHVYAEQQDSGTVAVPSRSDYGEISYRDWFSVGGFEYGYIAADPSDPNIVFATGWYGTLVRFDRQTGHIHYVYVPENGALAGGAPPLEFSPFDPHILYLGAQRVMKSANRGDTWQAISPDLTREPKGSSSQAAKKQAGRPAAISTIAVSFKDGSQIWAGTTNGMIKLTRDDGLTWQDVTPPGLAPGSRIQVVEASHHDAGTAYAAVGSLAGAQPFVYRTHDYGKNWRKITDGLPAASPVNVIREDPVRPGLLYCGSNSAVYVSFDDGDHWQSLQLNLPVASMRDLAVHGNDLVVATFGRALWILDDLTPLRQIDSRVAASAAHLFQPATALRVGWDENQETPLQPETAAGQNPPDGAIIDYYLRSAPAGEITLTIYDSQGKLMRSFSNAAPPEDTLVKNVPDYWLAPLQTLPPSAGMHRFVWDLRYVDPEVLSYGYFGNKIDYFEYTLPDHAIVGATPRHEPQGTIAVPGSYKVELSVGGVRYAQPLTIELDPREHVSPVDLAEQFRWAHEARDMLAGSYQGYNDAAAFRAALDERNKALATARPNSADATILRAAEKKIAAFEDGDGEISGFGPLNRNEARLFTMMEAGDERPSETLRAAAQAACREGEKLLAQWSAFAAADVPALNSSLARNHLAPIAPAKPPSPLPGCAGN